VSAQGALNRIAESPEGAQAIFNADVFGVFPKLLDSRLAKVRERTAEMIRTLATHGFVFEEPHGHSPAASSGSITYIGDLVSPSRVPLKHTHFSSVVRRYV
jgi:hypothetical protein